jgi:hypothetical protein
LLRLMRWRIGILAWEGPAFGGHCRRIGINLKTEVPSE